ncbi:uncharacterized protein BDR25DRAFT_334500 [Lindgomyces ingoldianus]|uniref:Uncharacterized protein n=1 Tax=Lindgomyces ingoldianus TaxID=673940 RepID=A0ACB6QUH8_9PLEO|nr:uncharacterized protein BDR25DRAFT_334500 [Lindgomyces ingoldianus]KAF2470501.1 hypothetical protein BDR25DRAFT_334500 [Lindgomyces ingoldianus]
MAATEETSYSGPIATNSYETALGIIPPIEQCQDVDLLRSLYDKGYGKWPPHVNLIYPFVAPEYLPRAKAQIQSRLRIPLEDPLARTPSVLLNKSGHFTHRSNHTVFLCEPDEIEASSMAFLRSNALESLGHTPTPCNFHLTIGQSEDLSDSSREFLLSKARLLPSLEFPIQHLAILIRERSSSKDRSFNSMRLWGIIDISGDESPTPSPFPEFWLQPSPQEESATGSEEENEEDDSDQTTPAPSCSRQPLPGTTYYFESELEKWQPCSSILDNEALPGTLTISSYNVLIDSEYPPARDRDPLLLKTLLSTSALADILVLQEVSDDFLSFLLHDEEIQHRFPFTSHGPPAQADIGPLPSLRNIVILSKWSFSWVFVPFHRRHKGAVVAQFSSIALQGSSETLPLIVAGVHLTCGLTDGAVAAKKVQLQNLKNYLSRNHASNPWVIAGDFNITTSTYSIDTALKSKSISTQTAKTLSSMETSMNEAGLIDAWAVARVEAADLGYLGELDDLFEGEDGATFNPRENELAAATSGTSVNRPQRYDRILVRPQGLLRINKFNQFGFPVTQGGSHWVPSDHWGIRCSMKVNADSTEKGVDDLNILKNYPIHIQHVVGALSDGSALTSALLNHQMFPTEDEIQCRREAFVLIKTVLLGSSDDDNTSMSDIPMVIVPVGSYALGVWTFASDIDCLCIGSISSKTFFKLARQRIHRAEVQGVRLMRRVEAHTGTMYELSVNGVSMDLQYCPAARIVERWTELPNLHQSDPIFNLSMLSLRKLKPYRDITYIQRTLPSMTTFRLAYRCIKLWAIQRGVYSSRFGYLGGIHLTLMLSYLCKRMVHDLGSVTSADLVSTFFHHYAMFDWKNDMVFDPFFHKRKPRYQRSVREPMVVLGFNSPNANVAHTSSIPGVNTLIREFGMASRRLAEDGMTWEQFFRKDSIAGALDERLAGVGEFLKSYDSYAKIEIQYWGRTLGKGKGLVGWVESRCLLLVVDIAKVLPGFEVRIWPARFTNSNAIDAGTDYQGCYLIGLSKGEGIEWNASKEDRQTAKLALEKSLENFQNKLQSDDKYYDPSSSWIGVSLVRQTDVKNFHLDDREWGDYVADIEEDSDDEEDGDALDELEEDAPTKKLPIRPAPSHSSKPISSSKLRPASDVLNRLRWDPNLDPNDYIVGYEDRFLGAKETTLEKWKTEQTDDEFIPQHRILYFKKRTDGVVVWERRTRTDLIFGSGVGAGDS